MGGLAIIFQELQCHDDNIRAATAALIGQFTSGTIPKEQIVDIDAVHICLVSGIPPALSLAFMHRHSARSVGWG